MLKIAIKCYLNLNTQQTKFPVGVGFVFVNVSVRAALLSNMIKKYSPYKQCCITNYKPDKIKSDGKMEKLDNMLL
jgi:hypothetical protein